MELNEILKVAIKGGASDIHLKSGLPPMFRVDGALVPLKNGERVMPDELQKIAFSIMNPIQRARFDENREADLAYGIPGLGRFRVNVFQQRGTVGIVFRVIPFGVKTIEQLYLPKVIEKISQEHRGLVLVTGTTGSGKSTTLAAMIEHINAERTSHIMTIEDPIEFLVRDRRSIVNQREIGVDTQYLLGRPPRGAAPGSRCDSRGRNARLRDDRDGHYRRRDRPPRHEHPAYPRCDGDDQPHHLGLSALSAEAGPAPALDDPEGRDQPAARAPGRRQGPGARARGARLDGASRGS